MVGINKIGFLVHNNQYNSKRQFTKGLRQALEEQGVETFLVDTAHGELGDGEIKTIEQEAPDLLATFSQMVPGPSGRLICEDLRLPHLSILLDPVIYSLPITASSYSIVSCVDRQDVAWLERMGFDATFFLPHAVEVPHLDTESARELDVVFLGSCYDHESYRRYWRDKYPKDICQLLNEAVEVFLGDHHTSLVDAVFQVWRAAGRDPQEYDLSQICFDVDYYARGRDRFELITSFERCQVHVFGEVQWATAPEAKGWSDQLKKCEHLQVHAPIPYTEISRVLSSAKVCLNSSPFFKDGTHERIFNSMAHGCITVTNRNLFMEEFFADGEEVILYDPGRTDFLEEQVRALLERPQWVENFVQQAWHRVQNEHTWSSRAETLQKELPPILTLMEVMH